jgi:hypothetical protein
MYRVYNTETVVYLFVFWLVNEAVAVFTFETQFLK